MDLRKTAWIGLGLLFLIGCKVLDRGEDWSAAAVPVGLTAWLPCIPVEKPKEADSPGDRKFECRASGVLVKLTFYGSDPSGSYDLPKGAAAIAESVRKSAKDNGGEVTHDQSSLTVSGLQAVRMKSTFVFPDEKSMIDGVLISDGEDAWLLQLIFPTRLASSLEAQTTKLYQTLEVRPD